MGVVLLVAIIIGYGEYRRIDLVKQINLQNQKLSSTMAAFISDINGIQDKITSIVHQNNLLNSTVQTQIDQTSALSDQFSQVNDTAIALDKLSKVDTQLLQKYSKVYFLNENYKPSSISDIPSQYGYDKTADYQILEGVEPFLDKMFEKASDAGIDLKVISAYRSFDDQSILKSTYNVIYGSGTANQFSADQGYSEHQLGTTIDITTPDTGDNFDLFDGTEAYKWLSDNAYRYGFILSYPKDNTYYTYEPWHWRFVGVDIATRLHREDKNFYDLDQRKINNYLGVFFD
jgi:D-alanyl-D-alanine carboxypeptidase